MGYYHLPKGELTENQGPNMVPYRLGRREPLQAKSGTERKPGAGMEEMPMRASRVMG